MTFKIHSIANAPEKSKPRLREVQTQMGFVPNIAGVMAGAPSLLEAYACLGKCIKSCSLSEIEQDVVLLTVSYHNDSKYCLDAHTSNAEKHKLSPVDIHALRNGGHMETEKLEALRQYTIGVMENHGRPPDPVKNRFLDAGYGPQQALEIILGITLKTLTNYTFRLAHPPIDDAFEVALLKKGRG
jgi:AhpD family alkylhydroperoxidase